MGLRVTRGTRRLLTSLFATHRQFNSHGPLQSGHNRWSKIKHDKFKEDAIKSKARTTLAQDIILASKYGGPDPKFNPKLAAAIASAKAGQFSKTSIEAAIAKGQGRSASGAPLENVTIEAMLPFGVAALIECLTDTKARVLQEVRYIITKNGGTITPTAFLFDKKGRVWFERQDKMTVDDAMDDAIEAGALEITNEDGQILVETEPLDVAAVADHLASKLGLTMQRTEVTCVPREDSVVPLSDDQSSELQQLLDKIEEEPSLQNVYVNAVAT